MIDTTSVINIISKLNMYIEEESKIINEINNILYNLENNYINDNSSIIKEKDNDIINNLKILLEDKITYTNYLHRVVNKYISIDELKYREFNNDIS